MEIKKLDIDGFGVFYQKNIDSFQKGVNVLFGENEAGKTTLLDFLRFTLIQYPTGAGSIAKRRPPLNGGTHGGKIWLQHSQFSDVCVYRHGNAKDFELALNGEKFTDDNRYKALINHATSDLYNNIYAITLDELSSERNLDESGMKDRIFSLGMGLSGADYGSFERSLITQSEDYFKTRGRTQVLITLTNEIKAKEVKIGELQKRLEEYNRLTEEKDELEEEKSAKHALVEELREKKIKLANYLKASEAYTKYERAQNALNSLGELKIFPLEILDNYKQSVNQLTTKKEEVEKLKVKHQNAKEAIKKLSWDEALTAHRGLLDYLKRNLKSYEESTQTIQQLQEKISQAKEETTNILQRLGPEFDLNKLLSLKGTLDLQTQATSTNERLEEIKREQLVLKSTQNNLEKELTTLESKRVNLVQRIDQLSIQNDTQRQKAEEQRIDLESNYDKALNSTIPTNSHTTKLLRLFSGLFILIGIGLFFIHFVAGIIVLIAAIIGFIVAIVAGKTTVGEGAMHTANPRKIKGELEHLKSEIQAYDKLSTDLNELLAEIVIKKGESRENTEKEEEFIDKTKKINQNWQELLVKNELPISVLPQQMNDILANVRALTQLQATINSGEKELLAKDKFLFIFKKEVRVLIPEDQISVVSITEAMNRLTQNEEQLLAKTQLEKEVDSSKEDLALAEKSVETIQNKLDKWNEEVGVTDASSFYLYFENQVAYQNHQEALLESSSMIKTLCGVNQFEETIAYLLAHPKSKLETDKEQIEGQFNEAETELLEMEKRLVSLTTEIRHVLEPDAMFQLQNDKESLILQLQDATKEWLTTKVALKVLKETKERYEADHQPEVIKNTRTYFKKITDGAYTDLRISLSDNNVEILDEFEKSKGVEELSRGTKEQLLLALRLGLIEEYEKSAEPLPVIFDDVMVNFDYHRTEKYAEIITEFAQSRQVIYFTCHNYVKEIFEAQGANIITW